MLTVVAERGAQSTSGVYTRQRSAFFLGVAAKSRVVLSRRSRRLGRELICEKDLPLSPKVRRRSAENHSPTDCLGDDRRRDFQNHSTVCGAVEGVVILLSVNVAIARLNN
jgi:hypothetical protein